MVKNPPANAGERKDSGWIPGLGGSPGEGMATHSSILAWKYQATVLGVAKSQTRLKNLAQLSFLFA